MEGDPHILSIVVCHSLPMGHPPQPHSAPAPPAQPLTAPSCRPSIHHSSMTQRRSPEGSQGISGVRDRKRGAWEQPCAHLRKPSDQGAKPPGESQGQLGPNEEVGPAPKATGRSCRPERQGWRGAKAQTGKVGEEAEDNKRALGLEPPGPVPPGPDGEGRGRENSGRLHEGTPERPRGMGAQGWPPELGGSTKGQA